MSKATATRATDIYETARENPYVQRLVEDDELRDSLRDAFEAAKGAYGRATSNSKGPVKAVTSDKKVQKDLREAAESLREASERLRKPPKNARVASAACSWSPWSAPSIALVAQRGRPQGRARHPLRRRRGVRVHQHHQHQRLLTTWPHTASSVAHVRSTLAPCVLVWRPGAARSG